METLLPIANQLAERLKDRHETIVVAESSTGGLISAALLSVPGASAYFLGGGVIYTGMARRAMLQIAELAMTRLRASSEPYALMLARVAKRRLGAVWSLAESGATGPTGNRYGDAAGHSCIAVTGPVESTLTLETGKSDRLSNMRAFASEALNLLLRSIDSAPRT